MESYKTMETMEEALDKLGCRQNFGQGPMEPVEPVQPNALLDIASLALYGCHALPVRLKILLDRLFSVLRPDQVVQVLRGFGWTQDDYARGYILNEANGASLDRFNICSPEEEPLVLQQFLRFGETRALTEQLLRGAAPGAAAAMPPAPSKEAHERLSAPSEPAKQTTPLHSPHQRDVPATTAPAPAPSRQSPRPPSTEGHRDGRDSREDDKRMAHALNFSLSSSAASRSAPSGGSVSPQQKHTPSGPGSVGRQSPPSAQAPHTPHGALSFLNRGAQPQPQSPPGSSPLNRLQNMQPFDFRKMAASAVRASPEPPAGPGGVPGLLNLRPPPPPPVPASSMSALPLAFSHSALGSVPLTAANLVASSFPGLISSAMAGHPGHPGAAGHPAHPGSKSPSTDLNSRAGSSDFGSGSDDEDDNSGSALNLSRDARDSRERERDRDDKMRSKRPAASPPPQQRSSKQPLSSFSPLKRQSAWPSSPLPANLGTALINPTTGKKRVQCNVCLKTFCDKGALKIHFSAVHLREMHRCTVEGCSMMFSSRRSRNRHSANPNPKLHSPHLRRKISPHDGRSSQAHPILLPPHQASLGALNPLSFGAFPLLPHDPRDHRDHRQAAMAAAAAAAGGASALDLNLKNSLSLSLRYERDQRERERQRDVNMTSLSMDEDDEDDEEGIVVVGGADDDDDVPEDLHQAKRPKFSVSDDGDDNSNSDDDSQTALDLGTSTSSVTTNGVDHHGLHGAHGDQGGRSGRKRKSQNPTRCTQPPVSMDDMSNYDDSSSDGGHQPYPGMEAAGAAQEAGLDLAVRRRVDQDHQETEERQAREQDSVQPPHEEGSSQDDQVFRLTKEQKGESIEPPTEDRESTSAAGGAEHRKGAEKDEEKDSVITTSEAADPNGMPSSPCAGSPPSSPAASPASSQGDGSHDEDGYYYPDGYFTNVDFADVPLDKDNPRRCTACGKVFQNHFGVKTHFQNVHLKLMHKCTVDGCNAAFPSKRSRDRHSANLNLHRKLLSTSSSPTQGDKPSHPGPLFLPHPDLLARLYADPNVVRSMDSQHPMLMPPFGYPPMAYTLNGHVGRAGSTSPTSPRSLDEELMGRPGRPPKMIQDPFLGARSRSDPGGLAVQPGPLPLSGPGLGLLAQRRASASDS
ncbi:zinc finger protein basonuclin-2-like [Frankliniella occidentalis]|uniref:Zinc finger protein basonuclin-2-like n=1 Tax=Frankliniella occidentalis TaxID=133901 RepID=A0A6J1T345_FRAOC|nr:zinc finger protein basonuclin-2-like [Frankliniella occidentalis]